MQRAVAAEALRHQRVQQAVDADAKRLAALLPQQQPQQDQAAGDQPSGPGPAASPSSAAGSWFRSAVALQKHAGGLPRWAGQQQAAPGQPQGPRPTGAAPTPGGAAPKMSRAQAAAAVDALLKGCRVPSPQPLAALLRAVCGATQVC